MSTTLTTTALGTSNLRGSSSRPRNLPTRASRNVRPNLRQNSLLSNSAATSAQGQPQPQNAAQPEPEPHGFYPAIQHFTDAVTALPRDFRRHTSLLKEVDAKAWALEENLQTLLQECLHERQTCPMASTTQTVAGSVSSVAGDIALGSTAGSVAGNINVPSNVLDTASQPSHTMVGPDIMRRRRLYAELRNNLMQMMMPLDEKNHVINNANEELSRQTRRQDEIWPHIADEISEETRLGSLRHWALTDLNPTKKIQTATVRGRDVVLIQDNEVAERSERRREAMAQAKKQKSTLPVDSDVEIRRVSRKEKGAKKLQEVEDTIISGPMTVIGNIPGIKVSKSRMAAKRLLDESIKKLGAPIASVTAPTSAPGGVAMSRENSQQETSKKRKAQTPATTVARKRINAAIQDSPKLGHSALTGSFGKETHKKSPALSAARPANARGRQASAQSGEALNRPQSSASRRNGVTATSSELERVAIATGKTLNEVKQTMKETVNSKGQRMLEEDIPDSVENRIRGGFALERSASKSSQLKKEAQAESTGRRTASPRLHSAAPIDTTKKEKSGRGKTNKNSTPVVSTFAEAEASESATEATSTAENGSESAAKLKRPVRPRMKDHHGLHDSLSPKGLPTKRMHKKNGSYSFTGSFPQPRSTKENDEDVAAADKKPGTSRVNSRSTKNHSGTEHKDGRNASSTPKIGSFTMEFVGEPESLPSATSDEANVSVSLSLKQPSSRRQSHNAKHVSNSTTSLDVKPPGIGASRATAASTALHSATSAASPAVKAETFRRNTNGTPLGSPVLEEDMADADGELEPDEDEEEDPNEQRYCYCNGVSYGEMVACDNESCAREWFHLECTGLRALPPARSTWYCDECKGTMTR